MRAAREPATTTGSRPVRDAVGALSAAEPADVAVKPRLATRRRVARHDPPSGGPVEQRSNLSVGLRSLVGRRGVQQLLCPRSNLGPDLSIEQSPLSGLTQTLAGALDVRQSSLSSGVRDVLRRVFPCAKAPIVYALHLHGSR